MEIKHDTEQPMIKEEIKIKILKYLERNTKGKTVYKNVWDAEKAILRKFIMINTYIKKKQL